jgi:hypothetical protein
VNHQWLFGAHFASTLLMTGIIWFVQVIHYPLMHFVDASRFSEYSRVNQFRTSVVVIGPMVVELLTAAALVVSLRFNQLSATFLTSLVLLVVVWASTFFWQVPLHERLLNGYDPDIVRRLVDSNWLRTICWSGRAVLLALMLTSRSISGA